MKILYKNKTVRIFSLGLMLAGLVSLGLFVQSCSQDDDYLASEDASISAKYLDFDVYSNTKFSQEDLKILTYAIERASKYMVFNGEKYVLGLTSGDEINISDRLFDYIYPSMQNMQITNIPRLKSDVEVTACGSGYNQVDCNLNHQETIKAFGSISTANTWYGYATSLVVGAANFVVGAIYAGFSALSSQVEGAKYQDYISSGSSKGSTLTITSTYIPNMGTVNTVQINYKK